MQTSFGDISKKVISLFEIDPTKELSYRLVDNEYVPTNKDFIPENKLYITNQQDIELDIPKRCVIRLNPEDLNNFILPGNCKLKIKLECDNITYNKLLALNNVKFLLDKGVKITNIDTSKIQYTSRNFNIDSKILFEDKLREKIKLDKELESIYNEIIRNS